MKLGLLGPAPDHRSELAAAARHLKDELQVERVLYLGADRMLDTVIGGWAQELVGSCADDFSIMKRATSACLHAAPEEIDQFLERERQRSNLRMFESLPGETTRSVELVGGKVAVMLYDKAHLEEDDILPATLLIFGKSHEPLVKLVGRRWFLSPGSFPRHGIMVVDDETEQLRTTTYGRDFELVNSQVLESAKVLKMRVSGSE